MKSRLTDAFEHAYDRRLERDFHRLLQRTPRVLPPDELRQRVEAFLAEHCICTLATCVDDIPRATVVRYRSRGLQVFVFTEGGGKVGNLHQNPRACLTVQADYQGFESCASVQAWADVRILGPGNQPAYQEIKEFFNLPQRADLQATGVAQIPDMFLLELTITRARLLNFPDGILNQQLLVQD